jgi:hypothetical protein
MKQLQESASQAQAALATIQAEADQRIAAKEAAAQAQVESYKQKWREEFDKRRKLHNLVSIHLQLTFFSNSLLHDVCLLCLSNAHVFLCEVADDCCCYTVWQHCCPRPLCPPPGTVTPTSAGH